MGFGKINQRKKRFTIAMEDKASKGSYSHIFKYTGVFGSVQLLGILISVVRTKVIAVLLGPHGVGLISLFNSTVKFLSDSTNLGLSMSAVKRVSMSYDSGNAEELAESVRVVRTISLVTAIVGTLVALAVSPLLSKYTFFWDGHLVHFLCLSPVVGLMAVTGGEVAILKGIRQLGSLARSTIWYLLAALLLSVPLYFFFGISGIVPAMVVMALAQMLITIAYSYRHQPLVLRRDRHVLRRGYGMISQGVGFVLASVAAAASELIIRSYINNVSDAEMVGLYNAGFMMTMTYAGMVFSALDADYYPRLSAISDLGREFNATVNRQIEVSLMIVSPFLVAFMVGLPLLLPLLYSGKFLPASGMVRLIILAMYLRAVKLPIAYLPLARGNSRSYLLMEGIYAVVLVLSTIVLFDRYGLLGAGMAILFTAAFDFLMLLAYMRYRYGYVISAKVMRLLAAQLPLGLLAFGVALSCKGWVYWLLGIALAVGSLLLSLLFMRRKLRQGE